MKLRMVRSTSPTNVIYLTDLDRLVLASTYQAKIKSIHYHVHIVVIGEEFPEVIINEPAINKGQIVYITGMDRIAKVVKYTKAIEYIDFEVVDDKSATHFQKWLDFLVYVRPIEASNNSELTPENVLHERQLAYIMNQYNKDNIFPEVFTDRTNKVYFHKL